MKIKAVMFEWTADEVMVPLQRFKQMSVRQYAVGEHYALIPVENVSTGSRGGFFADLRNSWDNLPDGDGRFPSFDHFRAVALVKGAGWATHTQTVLDTKADAVKFARGLRRIHEFAVIRVVENTVDVWVAKSIGRGQITAEEWKDVKTRALAWAAAQINVTREELERHGKEMT